ncbi:MAG: alpha/beta hydrolase [Planctomycetaceae bacterium]
MLAPLYRMRLTSFQTSKWGVFALLMIFAGLGSESSHAADVGPEPILLWPTGAPGAKGEEEVDKPSIRIYPATGEHPTQTAVVICPGGGYGALAYDHEGHQVAKFFNRMGVTGVVVKYRLGSRYHHPAPMHDAQRAIRYVRAHAKELKLSEHQIGVMGFSAGGHLASTVSTHFDAGDPAATDPIDRVSCRPDFSILCYPVISFKSDFGHKGSVRNLLGDNPDPALIESLSNETQVTKETPPTFLFHTGADKGVPVQNSLVYYRALVEQGVPAELHVYQNGPHGVGLAPGDPILSTWGDRLRDWMQTNQLLQQGERASVSGEIKLDGQPLRWGMITFAPSDDVANRLPVPCAMVAHGKFSIPASVGPTVGTYKIVVKSLGTVVPEPTIEDVSRISAEDVDQSPLTFRIASGNNTVTLELSSQ